MRFIIHIGPRKTGTTYLQAALFHSREAMAREGIYYHVDPPLPGRAQMHRSRLGASLIQNRSAEILPEIYAAQARGMHTAVISDEELSHVQPQKLQPLHAVVQELAQGDPVTIVTYCRRWSDRLPSLWAEIIKHGQIQNFAEWLLHTQLLAEPHPAIYEAVVWSAWQDLFGRDALRIVSYDVMMENKVDIARDFFDLFVGWHGPVPAAAGKSTNPRLSAAEVELLRLLNVMAANDRIPIQEKSRLRILRELAAAKDTRFARLGEPGGPVVRLDDSNALFDHPRASMLAIADSALVARGEDKRLMIPGLSRTRLAQPAFFGDRALTEALIETYARLREINGPPPVKA